MFRMLSSDLAYLHCLAVDSFFTRSKIDRCINNSLFSETVSMESNLGITIIGMGGIE